MIKTLQKKNDVSYPRPSNLFIQKKGEHGSFTQPSTAEKPFFLPSNLQAKLSIGQSGDKYEQEADQVANRVVNMSDAQVQKKQGEEEPMVQRKVENNEELPVQKMDESASESTASSDVEGQVNSLKGKGASMSSEQQEFYGSRFGKDFSSVRMHTGGEASKAADSLNAKAFATGNDVVFGQGQYQPGSTEGKKLIAHELTHVVQQNSNLPDAKNVNRKEVETRTTNGDTKVQRKGKKKPTPKSYSPSQWSYTFKADGHIIATAKTGATLGGLAEYWSGSAANYKGITYANGSKVTTPGSIKVGDKFDVFPIMPEFYRRTVGTSGNGNCGNAMFSYLGMDVGPANNSRAKDYGLYKKLKAGATSYAGDVVVISTTGKAPTSKYELVHWAIYLADDYVFTKNGLGAGKFEIMKLSTVLSIYRSYGGSYAGRWHK